MKPNAVLSALLLIVLAVFITLAVMGGRWEQASFLALLAVTNLLLLGSPVPGA